MRSGGAMTTTLSKCWPVWCGLTLACALAHAVVLQRWSWSSAVPADHAGVAISTRVVIVPGPTVSVVPEASVRAAVPMPAALRRATASTPARTDAEPTRRAAAIASSTARHLPTDALDIRPMPKSSPDERHVEGVHKSGLPIRVRLFVEADGSVSSAEVLSNAPGDEDAARSVAVMFRDTSFIPGRLADRDVASYLDVEIVLEPVLPDIIPLAHY
jgi:hypothetical protein